MKFLALEIYDLRIQFYRQKLCNFTKKICLLRALSPYKLFFWYIFSIQYFYILRTFKTVSHFFLLLCGFLEISKYLPQRVIVKSYFKRTFDS